MWASRWGHRDTEAVTPSLEASPLTVLPSSQSERPRLLQSVPGPGWGHAWGPGVTFATWQALGSVMLGHLPLMVGQVALVGKGWVSAGWGTVPPPLDTIQAAPRQRLIKPNLQLLCHGKKGQTQLQTGKAF